MFTNIVIEGSVAQPARVMLAPAEHIPGLWAAMLPILQEKGEELLTVFSEEEIFTLLCQGHIDAWLGVRQGSLDGFALCGWEVHTRAKYYHILSVMGDNLQLYLHDGLDLMEKYACGLGAIEVVIEGRRGWDRMLRRRGYKQRTIRLRRNVRRAWGN